MILKIQFKSRFPVADEPLGVQAAGISLRYHSLTRCCAGKQLWEFKDTSTQHDTKFDVSFRRQLWAIQVFFISLSLHIKHSNCARSTYSHGRYSWSRRGGSWALFNDAEHICTVSVRGPLRPGRHQRWGAETVWQNCWAAAVVIPERSLWSKVCVQGLRSQLRPHAWLQVTQTGGGGHYRRSVVWEYSHSDAVVHIIVISSFTFSPFFDSTFPLGIQNHLHQEKVTERWKESGNFTPMQCKLKREKSSKYESSLMIGSQRSRQNLIGWIEKWEKAKSLLTGCIFQIEPRQRVFLD